MRINNSLIELSINIKDGVFGAFIKKPSALKNDNNSIPLINISNGTAIITSWVPNSHQIKSNIINLSNSNDNLIMVRTGSNVGEVFKLSHLNIKQCVLHTNLINININANLIDTDYVYYYLKNLYLSKSYNRVVKSSTVKSISLKDVNNIIINYDNNYAVNSLIAKNLFNIDNRLSMLNRKKKLLKTFTNLLQDDIISGLNKILNTQTNASLTNVVINNVKTNIPTTYNVSKINKVLKFQKGKSFTKKDYSLTGTNIIKIKNIMNNQDETIIDKTDKIVLDKYLKKEEDTIICMSGYNDKINNGSIGKVSKIGSGYIDNSIYKVNSLDNEVIREDFIEYLLKTTYVQKNIFMYLEGTLIKHAYKSINQMEIYFPSIEEQDEMLITLNQNKKIIENISRYISLEKKLFKYFLQKIK